MITLEHIYRTERETLKFRLLALLLILVGIYFRKQTPNIWPLLSLFIAYMVYAMTLSRILIPRIKRLQIIYGMIVIDAIVASLGLYLMGGVRSFIFVLLPLLVIYYSMFFGYISSFFSATVFSFGYMITSIMTGEYIIQAPYIAFQVVFLYMAALLSGYLSRRRLQEMKERVELQEALHLESQARNLREIAHRLSSSEDLDLLLEQMITDALNFFKLGGCLIFLYDIDKTNFVVRAGTLNPDDAGVSSLDELRLPSAELEILLASDNPIMLQNLEQTKLPEWIKKISEKGLLFIPLKTEKEKMGLVILFEKMHPIVFSEEQVHLAQNYAAKFSQALEHRILHQEHQWKIEQIVEDLDYSIRRLEKAAKPPGKRDITVGNLRVNGPRAIATYGNKPLNLSVTEFELLYVLAENTGHPVNTETLLRRAWGEGFTGKPNVVDIAVFRLRRKLAKCKVPDLISTVRGIGYLLAEKQ